MSWKALIMVMLGLALASAAGPGVPAPRFTPVPDAVPSPSPAVVLTSPPVPSPSPPPPGPPPPPGYGFITQFDRPARLGRVPFRVGALDGAPVVASAVELWNGAGQGVLLEWEGDLARCDVVISWSSEGLPPGRVSATWWDAGLGWKQVKGVSVDPRERNVAQLVAHELGHVLGLDHSVDSRDMMAARAHRSRGSFRLTDRDREALAWLYRQTDFVPIRGRLEQGL